ncbi:MULTISPECIES: YugN family protein [Bacillus]|uniref:YugN family protein n=1 Tax=Bacillus TaxID=1386 RepID=UPI0002FF0A78|nr:MULTISPECIES: YugN family protein [Bacillus]
MRFESTGFEKLKADLNRLDEVMDAHGLIRAEQWDYERVSYDRKFELKEGVYYLRVQGFAVEGDVGAHRAIIQILTPCLGKHYYPHGIEYGENENFPPTLVKKCEQILVSLKTELDTFATAI